MPQESITTPAQFAGALVDGTVGAALLVGVTHVLRRCAGPILFLVLLIAALAYVGFALLARAGPMWVSIELLGAAMFGAIGWIGLRVSVWWLAAAWALHPIWDLGLHYFGSGRSFAPPLSYPIPCVSFDLVVAGYLAYLVSREAKPAGVAGPPHRVSS